MKLVINTPQDIGNAVRAMRKVNHVRLEDLAKAIGVSKQTATNLETGQAKLVTLLLALQEVGLELSVEMPDSALSFLSRKRDPMARRRKPTDTAGQEQPPTEPQY